MPMLIFETFLLMLAAAFIGVAIGHLLAGAAGESTGYRPWLADRRAHPPLPLLPAVPTLLSDAERARLTAAAATTPATPAPVATPAPAVVAPPAPVPTVVEAPAPVVTPAAPPSAPEVPAPVEVVAHEGPAIAEADKSRAAEADAIGARPVGLAAPVAEKADDLKRIKGIGRQNESRLHGLGIWHFHQIAAWTPENARWVGSFLAFQGRIEREDWIGQAKLLAEGRQTEFSKRVDAGDVPTSS